MSCCIAVLHLCIKAASKKLHGRLAIGHKAVVLEIFIASKHLERLNGAEAKELRCIAFVADCLEEIVKVVEYERIRNSRFGKKLYL